mmetsp:Transcript_23083/g.26746  ORF Transcript_23083/g.26746 Transcript_23083/m.26746 type:complete len:112 (-) Transcript_23083:29-364(-)
MGLSGSKYSHSSNDYELAIEISKELEFILVSQFHSTGRGLHEHITSTSHQLPNHLIKQMRYLATIRNKLIHERGFDTIPDRNEFIAKFEQSAEELDGIIQSRGGQSICIIQ